MAVYNIKCGEWETGYAVQVSTEYNTVHDSTTGSRAYSYQGSPVEAAPRSGSGGRHSLYFKIRLKTPLSDKAYS